jgi:hypothetical protein
LDDLSLPDGTEVLVTVVADDHQFWLNAGTPSLEAIWGNSEDDVYAELLKG